MYLGEGTVRNYLSSILDKLQLRDRTQVAVFTISIVEKRKMQKYTMHNYK